MSTPLSAFIGSGTAAASNFQHEPDADENPRTRRICILPGVLNLEVHPTLSGRQQAPIQHGVPVTFETFPNMKVRNWSVDKDDTSPPDTTADLTAKAGMDAVARAAWQGSRDMGFRELKALTPLSDAEAARLLAAVFPALDPSACPFDEENTEDLLVETIAENRAGERVARVATIPGVFRCLTCTLAWLNSTECEEEAALLTGGKELRAQLLDAYRTNQKFFKTLWSEWDADMKNRAGNKPGISKLDDGHLHVMRQLHEVAPEMRAAETIKDAQERSAEAQKEGMREFATTLASELKASRPEAPALDMDEVVRRAKEQLRAEMEAEKEAEKKKPGGTKEK
jgi:hypothetical protein